MLHLAFEYYGLVLLLSMAAIQAAASYSGLRGIVFFRNNTLSYIVSALVSLPCFIALLTWNWRNPTGIIEGAQQFYIFMLSMVSAIGFTIVLSSLINHRRFRDNQQPLSGGFESLRERTFFQALRLRWRNLRWHG